MFGSPLTFKKTPELLSASKVSSRDQQKFLIILMTKAQMRISSSPLLSILCSRFGTVGIAEEQQLVFKLVTPQK